ncbi:MAG: hypothetical protein HWD86_09165 [Kangiellaceae bacterium]|nr:hypothetical protein [Kangiellaceae bacterium]
MHNSLNKLAASTAIAISGMLCLPAAATAADQSGVMAAIADRTWQSDAGAYASWLDANALRSTSTIDSRLYGDLPSWVADSADSQFDTILQYWTDDRWPTVETFDEGTTFLADIKPNVEPALAMRYGGTWDTKGVVRYADIKPNVEPM